MIASTTIQLPFGKKSHLTLPLTFIEKATAHRQPRLDGRVGLFPVIDLARFRCEAVIDWVQFRVSFASKTQKRYVQNVIHEFRGRKAFVRPIHPGPGSTGRVFEITVQEPKSGAKVHAICSALALRFGEVTEPEITGIEFSLDFYPRTPSDLDRALLVGVIQRSIFTGRDLWQNVRSRPRCSKGAKTAGRVDLNNMKLVHGPMRGAPGPAFLVPESHNPAWIDGTLYLGAKEDDVMIRVMDKIIDRQNKKTKSAKILKEHEKRVRIEVTVKGDEIEKLGLTKLENLRQFRFSKLQGRYFQFKLPTFPANPTGSSLAMTAVLRANERTRAKVFLRTGAVGLQARDRVSQETRAKHLPQIRKLIRSEGGVPNRSRVGSGSTGTFIAYEELNRLAATAFRHLSERERRAWKAKR